MAVKGPHKESCGGGNVLHLDSNNVIILVMVLYCSSVRCYHQGKLSTGFRGPQDRSVCYLRTKAALRPLFISSLSFCLICPASAVSTLLVSSENQLYYIDFSSLFFSISLIPTLEFIICILLLSLYLIYSFPPLPFFRWTLSLLTCYFFPNTSV